MKLTFIEHACFMLENENTVIVIDPFSTDFSRVKRKFPQIVNPDYILLTHGHDDHMGALDDIYGDNTKVVACVELCGYLQTKGITNTVGMNLGGELAFPEFNLAMVKAEHSTGTHDGYYGVACGYVIEIGGERIYHFGDTGIFADMSLINELYRPTVGLVPIGGRFTMNADKALYACNNFFSFDIIVPMHYNTFPPIRANGKEFAAGVKKGKAVLLNPTESLEL